MVFGSSGREHDPLKPIILALETPNYFKTRTRKNESCSQLIIFWNLRMLEIGNAVSCLENTRAEHSEDPSDIELRISNMESISSKKHEKVFFEFLHVRPICFKTHDMSFLYLVSGTFERTLTISLHLVI